MAKTTENQLSDLTRAYTDGESVDAEIFSEQRSNILLIAGEHYSRGRSKYWDRLRDSKAIAQEQKLRLTKNHTYRIMRSYSNSIVSLSPFVTCMPQDPKDLGDQKSAELHNDVLNFAKRKYRLKEKVRDWADDFTGIGEVAVKIFFDPTLGKPVAYEQEVDEEGNPVFDEMGEPKASENLIFSGDFVWESVYGFNLLRCASAKSMDESPFITIRKMVDTKVMKARYQGQKDKQKCFEDTAEGTFLVFDTNKNAYGRSKNQCLVLETYYRPCKEYPNGYYYYWTFAGTFEEGELPFGVFPIAYAPFDKFQTSPRGRSHIKVLRPFQAEINRSASKIAEHQITLGDDKIITQAGTKITQGGSIPGVRGITVAGAAPQILPGRDGSQYLGYMNSQIDEMYKASLISEEMAEIPAQLDPYMLLFMAASQKKRFSIYTERFEQFLIDAVTIFFELARHYMPDDDLIEAIGKGDLANIEEFRSPKRLGYLISVEAQTDDIETKLGKQLVMNHFLQFAGGQLDKKDLGKFLKNSPYANADEVFGDFLIDEDAVKNNILALERGKEPIIHDYDDHPFMIRHYLNRMRKPDFEILPQNIKANFYKVVDMHEAAEAEKLRKLKLAESEFIPTGGALIIVDFYVPDPKNPLSSKRARLPYESLNWLVKKLEQQGSAQDALASLPDQARVEIAQKSEVSGRPPSGGMPPMDSSSPRMRQPAPVF
jgi:hypothetical protein